VNKIKQLEKHLEKHGDDKQAKKTLRELREKSLIRKEE